MKKELFLILLIFLPLSISCSLQKRNYSKVEIFIPDDFIITKNELSRYISSGKKRGNVKLKIIVYRYSSGKKIISFQGKNYSESLENGEIKVLLKFYINGKLNEALFIESQGKNKNDMMKNLSQKIKTLTSSI